MVKINYLNITKLNKISKKKVLKTIGSVLIISLISTTTIGKIIENNNVVKVSSETYKGLDEVNDIYSFYVGNELKQIDKSCNIKNLSKIESLRINAYNFDFNDLKYLPNLKTLRIYEGYNLLTLEDKLMINNCKKLERIEITDISVFNDDLSWLNDDVLVTIFPIVLINGDILNLVYYNKIEQMKISHPKIDGEFLGYNSEKLEKWDNQMKKIVDSFNFNKFTTDEEKIKKIIKYVCQNMEYDKSVSKWLENEKKDVEGKNLVIYYNENLLSTILDNNQLNGICSNYAALTMVLAYYSGLEFNYVCGLYESENQSGIHAWNCFNGNIIDTTYLDNNFDDTKTLDELLIKPCDPNYNYYNPESIIDLNNIGKINNKNIHYENNDVELYLKMNKAKVKKYYYNSLIDLIFLGILEMNNEKEKKKIKK